MDCSGLYVRGGLARNALKSSMVSDGDVSNRLPGFRVGVDIGGTFTDIVCLGPAGEIFTKKVSSTVDNYTCAIIDGLRELFQEEGFRG